MKDYLLGIIATALLVTLLNALGGGAGKGMRKLVGGVLLALAVFRPMGTMELTLPDLSEYRKSAEIAVSDGIAQAEAARSERITAELGAYILTKAAGLGLDAQVEVNLREDDIPGSVSVTAAASPAQRQALTRVIVRELGIEKEAVTWIDPHESSESTQSSEHTNIPS